MSKMATKGTKKTERLDVSADVTFMLPQNDPMSTTNHGMDNNDLHLWLSQSQPAASQPTVSLDESTVSDLSTSAASVQTNVREIQQIIKQNNNYLIKQNDVLFKLVNDISVHVAEISDKIDTMEKKFCAISTTVKNNKDVIGEVQRIVERLQKTTSEIKKRPANNKSEQIEMRLKTLENKLMIEKKSSDTAKNTNAIPTVSDNVDLNENTLTVHNLPYGMQDETDVNAMLHDGLGLKMHVKSATRAPSVNYRAGVLTIDLHSSDDVMNVMRRKWKLRNHHRYYNVYVEEKDPNRDNRIEESLKMLIDNIQYRNYNRNRYANNHHRQ